MSGTVVDARVCGRCRRSELDVPEAFGPDYGASGTAAYCRPCKAAYQREWRARRPERAALAAARSRARARALTRLGRRHPVELDELVRDELILEDLADE